MLFKPRTKLQLLIVVTMEVILYHRSLFFLVDSFLCRNLGIINGFLVFFLGTYLTATEYISASQSKGKVLVFRRGHAPSSCVESEAEESIQPVQHGVVDESLEGRHG